MSEDGRPGDTTDAKEFELLEYLIRHAGRVVQPGLACGPGLGLRFCGDTRIVDVHFSRLRIRLSRTRKNPSYIQTIRGVGTDSRSVPDVQKLKTKLSISYIALVLDFHAGIGCLSDQGA